jgi:hypothetical protein
MLRSRWPLFRRDHHAVMFCGTASAQQALYFSGKRCQITGLAASFSASALVAQSLGQQAEAARLVFRELEIVREYSSVFLRRIQLSFLVWISPRTAGLRTSSEAIITTFYLDPTQTCGLQLAMFQARGSRPPSSWPAFRLLCGPS